MQRRLFFVTDKKQKRQRAQSKGHWSEWLAAAYLTCKGYRIVAMRYRTKLGEIDLVARKRDLIAIVEVKARRDVTVAVDAVNYAAQRRIQNAADIWYSRQRDAAKLSIRFDIVAVRPWRMPTHFKDAF